MNVTSTPLVLVVEDEPLILDTTMGELEYAGFAVRGALSGVEALIILDREGAAIRAVFTDINLPGGVDGFQVAERARALHPDMPVIYTSGGMQPTLHARKVPNSHFVAKPYSPEDVAQRLHLLVTGG